MSRTIEPSAALTAAPATIHFTLDGQTVAARPGQSIWAAAQAQGVHIPHLCHLEGLRPDGNCRACVVEIEGERTLAPSCCRAVTEGMVVRATSERALASQKMVLELLLAEMPQQGYRWLDGNTPSQATVALAPHGELSLWAQRLNVQVRPALKALQREQPPADVSHPAMAVNLDACIQCGRCVRACREEQANGVIGMAGRGAQSRIVFDLGTQLASSSCVACGECVQACPTGALSAKTQLGSQAVDRTVDSVCPFCGVGCQLSYHVKDERIVSVSGRDGPANHGRLCVKGRFGFDYVHHPKRLTVPLIRKRGVPKDPQVLQSLDRDNADWSAVFREASWDEALALAANGFARLKQAHGGQALAGLGSAKGSNEEAYLFQKLVRTGFGTHNVDHCTRLCHASSVAALLEGVGSGAVSNQVGDVAQAELILVMGSNPTANHPVAATWMKNAAQRGCKIVLADPRGTDLARHAWRVLAFRADTDVALLNALIYTVIEEDLVDHDFIARRTRNFEAIRANIQGYSPEAMAPICGIPAATLREVARAYARAKSAMILWGMGVSQHVHGTDNVRCLITLCSLCGHLGKPGSGLHPLRGQNNVQGASDAGLIPMMLPNYQRVADAGVRAWFEDFWQTPLSPDPGLTVVEMMQHMLKADDDPHKLRGLYIMGENPAMSDPNLNHARHALASLQHLVVQDIFMTETAWLADVVLPASAWPEKTGTATNTDRMVQLGQQALAPPGQARADLWIIQQLAQRLGLHWSYPGAQHGVAAVFEEMRQALHRTHAGITWARLQQQSCVTYPCHSAQDPGQPTLFAQQVDTPDGLVNLVPVRLSHANERPDDDYPWVLITGRQLEHWHTGSMTRRASVLDALEPSASASLCGSDLRKLGLQPGDWVQLRTRRGHVRLQTRQDDGTPAGCVFVPFAFYEAAANLLTNAALDPVGKIPEFKYCAVAVEPAEQVADAAQARVAVALCGQHPDRRNERQRTL
ncbi:MAG: formate dehydrogenase subunit alpha [Rhodoferax sp.]